MSRRVHWVARGAAFLNGLEGCAIVTDRDVLPVTAALRALERRSGLEVKAFGCSDVRRSGVGRCYSVRLERPGQRSTGCMLVIEPERAQSKSTPSMGDASLVARVDARRSGTDVTT